MMTKYVDFDFNGILSITACAEICKKTPQTIYRWQREGWPAPYRRLCELHASGRIMPLKWRYIRFNTTGKLQTDNGEIDENELLSIPHTRSLLYSLKSIVEKQSKQIQRLKREVNSVITDSANDFYS